MRRGKGQGAGGRRYAYLEVRGERIASGQGARGREQGAGEMLRARNCVRTLYTKQWKNTLH